MQPAQVALASTASGPFLVVAVTIDIALVRLAFYLEKQIILYISIIN